MSDDLVSRLRQDAEMFQDGPQRNLTKLWHSEVVKDAAKDCQEAATALTEARAEIERLRRELADTKDDYLRRHKDAVSRFEQIAKLESELATLRARVREVVGPLISLTEDFKIYGGCVGAARQLMEEVK